MPDWNELFERDDLRWVNPQPSVVSLSREMDRRGFSRVLDLGCGAGRHTTYLSGLGFEVVGLDPASSGLEHCYRDLVTRELPRRLVLAGMERLPFPDYSYQCVISTYVIHHNTMRGVAAAIGEIERILVPGGLFLATVLGRGDFKYGVGRKVEEGTYVPLEGDERGVVHHFFDREEIGELLGSFRIISLASDEEEVDFPGGRDVRHDHWEVLAEKLPR